VNFLISLRAYSRPDYLRESLESWAKADGIEQAHMIFNLEPDQPDVLEVVRFFDACAKRIIVNEKRLGGPLNGKMAFVRGFATGADAVIHAEDDVIVSSDVLTFFDYAQRYRDDQGVFAVCSFQNRTCDCGRVHRDDYFTQPSPWLIWRDRWENTLRDNYDVTYEHDGFDWHIQRTLKAGRDVIKPCWSRSQHIGREGGTHCLPEMFAGLQAPNFTPGPHPGGFRE
jgi:GT2 family glycosyltransferase